MADAPAIDRNMHNVVQEGNLNEVQALVKTYSLSYCTEWAEGYSLLCEALAHRHMDVAKFLVSCRCKVQIENPPRATSPLYFAVKHNFTVMTGLLLSKGASPGADLNEMLSFCVKYGNSTIIEYFMDHKIDVSKYKDEKGRTLLHFAAVKSNCYIMHRLFCRRVCVNAQDKNGVTALHIAANNGFSIGASRLIECGASVDLEYNEPMFGDSVNNEQEADDINSNCGFTALHIAAFRGHKSVVKVLLKHKAEVNCKSKLLNTPLHFAVTNNHFKIAQLLLKSGADCILENNKGMTPLHNAAKTGTKRLVQVLLDLICIDDETVPKCEHYVNLKSADGLTPLHLAAQSGHADIVNLLLKHGADLHARCLKEMTPLHYAAMMNDVIPIKFLIGNITGNDSVCHCGRNVAYVFRYEYNYNIFMKRKSYVNLQSKDGSTPLHVAAVHGCEDVAKLLLFCGAALDTKCSKGMTALHCAAKTKNVTIAKLLLKNFTKVRSGCYNGEKITHEARRECVAEMILKNKAYVNSQSNQGKTALHIAASKGSAEVGKLLLLYGADISIKCLLGMTALHYVASAKSVDFARLLIRNVDMTCSACPNKKLFTSHEVCKCTSEMLLKIRAYINIQSNSGLTALHMVSFGDNSVDVAKLLLEFGGDVNIVCKNGRMPLHYAAAALDPLVIPLLSKYDADVDARCDIGNTPLHYAVHFSNVQAAHLLLQCGADINIKNLWEHTPVTMLPIEENQLLCELFLLHIIRSNVAGLYISARNVLHLKDLMSRDMESATKLHATFLEEVKKMSREVILKDIVSLYDILLCKSINQIARYACNESSLKKMCSINCRKEFPIYMDVLQRQLSNGLRRKVLLEKLSMCEKPFYVLPPECAEIITSYLSNRDLENLIKASRPLKQCSTNTNRITFPKWLVLKERFSSSLPSSKTKFRLL